MKTATFLKSLEWSGDARVYQLSEPLAGYDLAETETSLVIVSAAVVPYGGGPETYIFPATVESLERGEPSNWCEMPGSYKGGLDHAEALRDAGYEVVS